MYYLKNCKIKNNKNDKDFDLYLKQKDIAYYENKESKLKEIELKNIIRSKLECQRLAKANSDIWKTFITLTFAENITDLNIANNKYKNFIRLVKKNFKDFKCIAIPEFQKRGAIHYHLLTNIDIENQKLIFKQEDNSKFLHIKYWNHGFTKVDNISGDIKKIIGYISKYMTKDIDNRLYGHHRYFYTRNLERPKINYINILNLKELSYYNKIVENKKVIYENNYINSYNNDEIVFCEFFKDS